MNDLKIAVGRGWRFTKRRYTLRGVVLGSWWNLGCSTIDSVKVEDERTVLWKTRIEASMMRLGMSENAIFVWRVSVGTGGTVDIT